MDVARSVFWFVYLSAVAGVVTWVAIRCFGG